MDSGKLSGYIYWRPPCVSAGETAFGGYGAQIEDAASRWQSDDPGALARSAESLAIELHARQAKLDPTITRVDRRIDKTQEIIDELPAKVIAAEAVIGHADREEQIRQNLPQPILDRENRTRDQIQTKARQQAAKLAAERQAATERSRTYDRPPPSRGRDGPSLSM